MARTLILLGLLPVIIGIAMRKWFGERVLQPHLTGVTQLSGRAFVERLAAGSQWNVEISEGKRSRVSEDGEFTLSRELAEERDLISLAETGLLFGLALLGRSQPELLKWRAWSLKFSWAFPAFTILVVIFAALAGNFRWGLPIAFIGMGVGTSVGFLAAWVEWQAAGLTGRLLAERAIITREDDRIAIAKSMRALAARRCVPGMLQVFFPEASTRRAKAHASGRPRS